MGRLAYVVDNGARILPFNYIVAEDSVILRTVPDGEVYHHALSSICAFEVDETDEFFQSGWSVVVVGRLELATDEDFARMLYGRCLSLGSAVIGTCSYGCGVTISPGGG